MPKFNVQIEGTAGTGQTFTELIEVDAENEDDANAKARELCLKPGPQGALYKYGDEPEGQIWMITRTTKK